MQSDGVLRKKDDWQRHSATLAAPAFVPTLDLALCLRRVAGYACRVLSAEAASAFVLGDDGSLLKPERLSLSRESCRRARAPADAPGRGVAGPGAPSEPFAYHH